MSKSTPALMCFITVQSYHSVYSSKNMFKCAVPLQSITETPGNMQMLDNLQVCLITYLNKKSCTTLPCGFNDVFGDSRVKIQHHIPVG